METNNSTTQSNPDGCGRSSSSNDKNNNDNNLIGQGLPKSRNNRHSGNAQTPILDLFSDMELGNVSDRKKSQQESKVAEPSSSSDDVGLKAIVKDIDIFSNKIPRPIQSNRFHIPHLTLKNPLINQAMSIKVR